MLTFLVLLVALLNNWHHALRSILTLCFFTTRAIHAEMQIMLRADSDQR